jgi:hypothetical protein
MAQYVTSKPRDNALGIAAAVLACALLFGCAQCEAPHSRRSLALASHFHDLTSVHVHRRWYEYFDRKRAGRINTRLLAYVRRLEQARLCRVYFCSCRAALYLVHA